MMAADHRRLQLVNQHADWLFGLKALTYLVISTWSMLVAGDIEVPKTRTRR